MAWTPLHIRTGYPNTIFSGEARPSCYLLDPSRISPESDVYETVEKTISHQQNQILENQAEIMRKLDRLFAAFPGGDVEGHARYHQIKIEEILERKKLRAAIEEKTISGLVWALIVSVAVAVGNYLKDHLK